MIGRAVLVVPLILVFSTGPGLFFVKRLRWNPLERLAGSIALSLILIFALTFSAYVAGFSRPAYYVIAIVLAALSLASIRDAAAVFRSPVVRQTAFAFCLLLVWALALQSLIRHYSGGDWCCDWLEHYQRSLFFVERWPKDFLFIGRYLLTGRPPFMNVLCAFFLGIAGTEFPIYQTVSTVLNLFAFFPCCVLARQFAPRVRGRGWLLMIFLGANPMFFMNTTFPWTKVLAAFYVILALHLYLAGWRKHDAIRFSAAFLCLAAGAMVHFSSAPYAVLLAALFLTTVLPTEQERARTLVVVVMPAVVLVGAWLAWTLSTYGADATFTGNVTVEAAAAISFWDNVLRIASNTFHTFRPYLYPGGPDDTPLRLLTDRAFTFYQENLLGAIGSINAYAALVMAAVALRGETSPVVDRRQRRFWLTFVPLAVILGIAVDSEVTPSGFANICLQPIVYIAVTFVAARYPTLSRPTRIVVWCGVALDFVLGVALEVNMESQLRSWARSPNWDLKRDYQIMFLGDALRHAAPMIESALIVGAGCAFLYLGRIAAAPARVRS
jgi:hypothetical protein